MAHAWTARVAWALDGRVSVSVVSVRASTLRQATWNSLKLVEDSTGAMVTGIEIQEAREFRRRSQAIVGEPCDTATPTALDPIEDTGSD